MSTLNWNDLSKDAGDTANTYEPLPDGDYELVVAEATATVSQSGKTMFKIKAQVESGPHAKRLVWDNLVVSPENPTALGIFFRKMSALGLNQDYFSQGPSNAQIEQTIKGRRFRGQVGSRTWQGTKRNEIKNYYPHQAGSPAAAGTPAPSAAAAPPPAPAPAPAPAPPPAPAAADATSAPAAPF